MNIWSVGLAVERRDGTEGVKRAEAFTIGSTTPQERVCHHWIDLARAYQLHGDRTHSLIHINVRRAEYVRSQRALDRCAAKLSVVRASLAQLVANMRERATWHESGLVDASNGPG